MIEKVKKIISPKRIYMLLSQFNRHKVFCISFQRTATTSVGLFFKQHGYKLADYGVSTRNEWTLHWYKGDYESIFRSFDFRANQVFEDDPWMCVDFYKILFHRFPKSKFVLFERDADDWYDSMIRYSNGKTLGNTLIHSKIYRREAEYYSKNLSTGYKLVTDNLLSLSEAHRDHYKEIYRTRIFEVKNFFQQFGSERLFYSRLEDTEKWSSLGKFFRVEVPGNYTIHANKSHKK